MQAFSYFVQSFVMQILLVILLSYINWNTNIKWVLKFIFKNYIKVIRFA